MEIRNSSSAAAQREVLFEQGGKSDHGEVKSEQVSTLQPMGNENTNLFALQPTRSQSGMMRAVRSVLFESKAPRATLKVSVNERGKAVVDTADGYKIVFMGKNKSWKIITPEGTTTKIWGDPHVVESDRDSWDFAEQSSFVFGKNKITVETTPWGNQGATVTRTVSIYNGEDRVTMTNIDQDEPELVDWTFDRAEHDRALADGTRYELQLKRDGGGWNEQWLRVEEDREVD